MSGLAVVASGVLFGLGACGLLWSWRSPITPGPGGGGHRGGGRAPSSAASSGVWHRLVTVAPVRSGRVSPLVAALAVAAGILVGVVTRWPVAVPITALAVYGLPSLFGRTAGAVSIDKIEAIATWTEMLQSTIAASAGLGQAIIATAPLSPPPLRGAATRLAGRLSAGMDPGVALLQFADELGDPCADRVVCALQLAMSARAQRVGDLLAALADSTRDEVALRLRVETGRASVRSGVRTVLVFSLAFAVALVALAHTYLAPFGTTQGQVVLALVGLLYASGMSLMVALARPPAPVRLLGGAVIEE